MDPCGIACPMAWGMPSEFADVALSKTKDREKQSVRASTAIRWLFAYLRDIVQKSTMKEDTPDQQKTRSSKSKAEESATETSMHLSSINGEEVDAFDEQQQISLDQVSRSRCGSTASSLASNRRAYITRSIASVEGPKRRESTVTMAVPPTSDQGEAPTVSDLSQALEKLGSPPSINDIEEQPRPTITSSFLDTELVASTSPSAGSDDQRIHRQPR